MGFEALVMFPMIIIALWRREHFLYIVASLVVFFIAISWIHTYPAISIPLVALALYFLYEAVVRLFLKKNTEDSE